MHPLNLALGVLALSLTLAPWAPPLTDAPSLPVAAAGPSEHTAPSGTMAAHDRRAGASDDPLQFLCDAFVPAPDGECTTQYDGGAHGDATGDCGESDRFVSLASEPTNGLVHPFGDLEDHYTLRVSTGSAPATLVLESSPATEGLTHLFEHRFTVRPIDPDSGCLDAIGSLEHHGNVQVLELGALPPGDYDVGIQTEDLGIDVPERRAMDVGTIMGSSSGSAALVDTSAAAQGCHGFCIVAINGAVGYSLQGE